MEILHSYISKYRVWTVTINYDIGLGSEKFVLQFLINCVRLMEGVEMKNIFVNLKRFDVPKSYGGICPVDNPSEWIQWIIDDCVKNKLGMLKGMRLTFLVPESLIIPAIERLSYYSKDDVSTINIGSQGVYRENVEKGVNFGAFTTNLPAAAAKNSGCKWTIIGHSEERKDKLGIISSYDPESNKDKKLMKKARHAVDCIINQEVICALETGLDVLMCIGETAEEKGEGSLTEQANRTREALKSQIEIGLKDLKSKLDNREIVIGYEPIWAIGPGKTPPTKEYISFVSKYIKESVRELFGYSFPVVYGGGLKEENASMIADIETIDGGLVALTKFTGDIGFSPNELSRIIDQYK